MAMPRPTPGLSNLKLQARHVAHAQTWTKGLVSRKDNANLHRYASMLCCRNLVKETGETYQFLGPTINTAPLRKSLQGGLIVSNSLEKEQ